MLYYSRQYRAPVRQLRRLPWFMFLFLAVAFFFVHHDLSSSKIYDYNQSESQIAASVVQGSLVHRIAILSLALFGTVSLFRHRANGCLRIHGSFAWIVLSFAAWSFLSLIWTDDLTLTFRRLVVFGTFGTAALAIVRRLSLRNIVFWTFFSTTLFLVVGVCTEVLLGTFHPFVSGYRFAGTLHPNVQGINCALLVLSGVAGADVEKQRRTIFRSCAFLGIGFLILTGSRSAFVATLIALAAYLVAVAPNVSKIVTAYALTIIFCLLLLFLGSAFTPDLKSAVMLGRDDSTVESLNGRSGIWKECAYYVAKYPVTGYGFGGFWNEAHIAAISSDTKWGVGGAHSAYVDCLLQLGLVGLIVYILTLVVGIKRAFRFYRLSHNPGFAFCGALLLFCLVSGSIESAVITPTLLMFLYMIAVTRLAFASFPIHATDSCS